MEGQPSREKQPHISKIEPGLYLGDLHSSSDLQILKDSSISALISVTDANLMKWSSSENRALVSEDRHMIIPCFDTDGQDLLTELARICDFIEEHQGAEPQKSVLVHCTAGVSRSATVVVAYLMRKYRKTMHEAVRVVQKKRKIRPNANFLAQLAVWEATRYELWEERDKSRPKAAYLRYLESRGDIMPRAT